MAKNIIIIVLFALVLVMFFSNMQKNKELFQEVKRRIKHQLDLANTIESESPDAETTTGPSTEDLEPGNEEAKPAVEA